MGVSLNNMAKILKCMGNDDVLTMKVQPPSIFLPSMLMSHSNFRSQMPELIRNMLHFWACPSCMITSS